jgi:subtilase family serine protease
MTSMHRSISGRRGRVAALAGTTALATAFLGATATSAGAAPASATTGWAPTATQALTLVGALGQGTAAPATALRLTIGLAPQDRAGLDALIVRQATPGSADYGRYLTPAAFTQRFGATPATASAVASYLTSAGMRNVTVSSNRLQVTADATVAQAQSAFHTTIASFVQDGRTVLANTTPALVPSSLAGKVTGVAGLSTLGFTLSPHDATNPKLTGFYPKEFNTVYHSAGTRAGTGITQAVIAEGDVTQTLKDLRTAEAKQGLPRTTVTVRYTGIRSSDTAGVDEWDLDTQTSTGVAPASTEIIYVATSLTDSDLARAVNAFAAEGTATVGSASLGECDALPYLDGTMAIDDIAFAEAAAQGQTFHASTGDTGASCPVAPTNGVPGSGPIDTSYPASSPYVNAVGGTTLDADATTDAYGTEIAWYAGGGGSSPVEYPGAWQNGVVPGTAVAVSPQRGLPDVAFDADPNTGALIYIDGTVTQIGGTSLSSPLAMGLLARIQATHDVGFVVPKLYALYKKAQAGSPLPPSSVPGFHDVTVGTNAPYPATPGWDYDTGLGSYDVAALSKALR